MPTSILVVSGSLRSGSFNTHLARQAVTRAPQGVTARLSDAPRTLPHYDGDLDTASPPSEVVVWRQSIMDASAILFVTPTYNHALPGVLKNALDWASRPFGEHCLVGKTVAVLGCSPGSSGSKQGVAYLRTILPFLGATLVGEEVPLPQIAEKVNLETGWVSDDIDALLRNTMQLLAG
ncbi:MAG: NADPH-dependent FMN reductase [Ilumatobacteraceae bacterium]